MDSIENCNAAWQQHLKKYRLALLFLEPNEIDVFGNAYFKKISISSYHMGLLVNFINPKTGMGYTVHRAKFLGWGSTLDSTPRKNQVIREPSVILLQLLDDFQWEKYALVI